MTNSRDVYIVGAGGFGVEALQYAADAGSDGWDFRVAGFLDDGLSVGTEVPGGYEVVGRADDPALLRRNIIVATGDPAVRARVAFDVARAGGSLVTLVHPTAYVPSSAEIGEGCILCPFAMVGVDSRVGTNVAMNVYASVGHHATIGPDSVLSPYTAVLGSVHIGPEVYLATHCTIAPGLTIGSQSKVSAGAVVTRSAPAGSLLVGNPAKGRVLFPVADDVDS